MVVVPASLYFFSYFHRVAPAVVAQDLMRDFGIPAAALGTLVAIYPYVFAAMALVAGSLAAITGFLIAGLSEYNFGDSEVVMVAWALMALPWAAEAEDASPSP